MGNSAIDGSPFRASLLLRLLHGSPTMPLKKTVIHHPQYLLMDVHHTVIEASLPASLRNLADRNRTQPHPGLALRRKLAEIYKVDLFTMKDIRFVEIPLRRLPTLAVSGLDGETVSLVPQLPKESVP